MRRILILLVMMPVIAIGQTSSNEILTDSTIVVGLISEDAYVGKNIDDYCYVGFDKELKKDAQIFISGIKTCKKSYAKELNYFYEIVYKGNFYFVEKEKISTRDSYYSQIEKLNVDEADKFRNHAKQVSELLYVDELKKIFKFLENCKTKGLAVLDWSFYDESEYTDGTSIKIKVYNPTNKVIKYLWFTFVGFNSVDDVVIDRLKKTSKIVTKGIGPIKPKNSGSYEYDYVWHSDFVERVKISQIKVQYMDGSIKIILNPKEIILPEKSFELLEEE